MPGVGEASRDGPDEEEEKDLHRANPGYIGGRPRERADVVGLEDAKGVYKSPAIVR